MNDLLEQLTTGAMLALVGAIVGAMLVMGTTAEDRDQKSEDRGQRSEGRPEPAISFQRAVDRRSETTECERRRSRQKNGRQKNVAMFFCPRPLPVDGRMGEEKGVSPMIFALIH
jgi:hypothetical protein